MADADAATDRGTLAILSIDLAAVAENYLMLAAKVAPAECAGVVKADAYGLGVEWVAPALWRAGCRTFFVAAFSEGLALRGLLPEATIYVLNGLHGIEPKEFAATQLRPVLVSRREIDSWLGSSDDKRDARFGLHLDTGMARLGMPPDEFDALISDRDTVGRLHPSLVMSHFACADTPDHPLNGEQARRFRDSLERLQLPNDTTRSLAASSGIFLGTENAFRVGPWIAEVERSGKRVIRCNLGEPDFPLPKHIAEEVKRRIDAGETLSARRDRLPLRARAGATRP